MPPESVKAPVTEFLMVMVATNAVVFFLGCVLGFVWRGHWDEWVRPFWSWLQKKAEGK